MQASRQSCIYSLVLLLFQAIFLLLGASRTGRPAHSYLPLSGTQQPATTDQRRQLLQTEEQAASCPAPLRSRPDAILNSNAILGCPLAIDNVVQRASGVTTEDEPAGVCSTAFLVNHRQERMLGWNMAVSSPFEIRAALGTEIVGFSGSDSAFRLINPPTDTVLDVNEAHAFSLLLTPSSSADVADSSLDWDAVSLNGKRCDKLPAASFLLEDCSRARFSSSTADSEQPAGSELCHSLWCCGVHDFEDNGAATDTDSAAFWSSENGTSTDVNNSSSKRNASSPFFQSAAGFESGKDVWQGTGNGTQAGGDTSNSTVIGEGGGGVRSAGSDPPSSASEAGGSGPSLSDGSPSADDPPPSSSSSGGNEGSDVGDGSDSSDNSEDLDGAGGESSNGGSDADINADGLGGDSSEKGDSSQEEKDSSEDSSSSLSESSSSRKSRAEVAAIAAPVVVVGGLLLAGAIAIVYFCCVRRAALLKRRAAVEQQILLNGGGSQGWHSQQPYPQGVTGKGGSKGAAAKQQQVCCVTASTASTHPQTLGMHLESQHSLPTAQTTPHPPEISTPDHASTSSPAHTTHAQPHTSLPIFQQPARSRSNASLLRSGSSGLQRLMRQASCLPIVEDLPEPTAQGQPHEHHISEQVEHLPQQQQEEGRLHSQHASDVNTWHHNHTQQQPAIELLALHRSISSADTSLVTPPEQQQTVQHVPQRQPQQPSPSPFPAINFSTDLILERKIGSGNFGIVYAARWLRAPPSVLATKPADGMPGVPVAVKVVRLMDTECGNYSSRSLDALKQEIQVLSRLQHPHIISFLGACLAPPNVYIVEQLAERGTLLSLLRKHQESCGGVKTGLPYQQVLSLGHQVACAMEYLHSCGVIHRDLKTGNVLLDSQLCALVADFGLARNGGGGSCLSTKNAQAGTPSYMAPEQFEGKRTNEKVDVYAFGVVLWELLTGEQPWSDLDHPMQIIFAVGVQCQRLPIPEGLPSAMCELLNACFDDRPECRPPFSALVEVLSGLLAETHNQ